eukprot:356968-Chlamydomonas_euryale.AAC.36
MCCGSPLNSGASSKMFTCSAHAACNNAYAHANFMAGWHHSDRQGQGAEAEWARAVQQMQQ